MRITNPPLVLPDTSFLGRVLKPGVPLQALQLSFYEREPEIA